MLKDKLVTVLGGGGFLGRYVVQDLLRAGARVRIAQRDPRGAFFLRPLGGLGQTQFVAVDIARPDTVTRALSGADAAVNLIGSFTGDLDAIHARGAGEAAAAAAAQGLSAFVQISAIGADAQSGSVYARTKGEGEARVREAFPQATILRPATVFGREDQFINRFAGMIRMLPVVPILRAETRFQPVFVGDVAAMVMKAVDEPTTFSGQTLELGGPQVLTMRALHEWIARQSGRRGRFVELPDVAGAAITRMPFAPISRDQWLMLQNDTVVTGTDGLAAAGIAPTPLDAVAEGWLVQYRRLGRFARRAEA